MKKPDKIHQNARSIGKKLKTKSLVFFDSFFFHVNRKAFGASFLYWVDFNIHEILNNIV